MYVVKSNLKCDGKVYVAGDKFDGKPSEQLLASGALEKKKVAKKKKEEVVENVEETVEETAAPAEETPAEETPAA